jgi:hypothetical protein
MAQHIGFTLVIFYFLYYMPKYAVVVLKKERKRVTAVFSVFATVFVEVALVTILWNLWIR